MSDAPPLGMQDIRERARGPSSTVVPATTTDPCRSRLAILSSRTGIRYARRQIPGAAVPPPRPEPADGGAGDLAAARAAIVGRRAFAVGYAGAIGAEATMRTFEPLDDGRDDRAEDDQQQVFDHRPRSVPPGGGMMDRLLRSRSGQLRAQWSVDLDL